MTHTELPEFVEIADGLPEALRAKLQLATGEKLRLCYLSLANDVARVQHFWAQGKGDPRSQKATYAGMFFELVDKLGAQGLLMSLFDTEPPKDQAVKIAKIERQPEVGGGKSIVDQVMEHVEEFQPHLVVISPSISAEIIPQIVQICPAVYYAHSLFWPDGRDAKGASIKGRLRELVRKRQNRRNLAGISGILAPSDIALQQTLGLVGRGLPVEISRNQFILTPENISPQSAKSLLYIGEFEA